MPIFFRSSAVNRSSTLLFRSMKVWSIFAPVQGFRGSSLHASRPAVVVVRQKQFTQNDEWWNKTCLQWSRLRRGELRLRNTSGCPSRTHLLGLAQRLPCCSLQSHPPKDRASITWKGQSQPASRALLHTSATYCSSRQRTSYTGKDLLWGGEAVCDACWIIISTLNALQGEQWPQTHRQI